jgi:hypothetical protein
MAKWRKVWGKPGRKTLDGRRNFVVSNGTHMKDSYGHWTVIDWLCWALVWQRKGDPFF